MTGHQGNDWPTIKIGINDQIILDSKIVGTVTVEKTLDPSDQNVISICHYDKNNDTMIDVDGNILRDRYCLLDGIWINNICFDQDFFSDNDIPFVSEDGEKIITNYFGKNGTLEFRFEMPLWKLWLNTQ